MIIRPTLFKFAISAKSFCLVPAGTILSDEPFIATGGGNRRGKTVLVDLAEGGQGLTIAGA